MRHDMKNLKNLEAIYPLIFIGMVLVLLFAAAALTWVIVTWWRFWMGVM